MILCAWGLTCYKDEHVCIVPVCLHRQCFAWLCCFWQGAVCAAMHSCGDALCCIRDALNKPFCRELTCVGRTWCLLAEQTSQLIMINVVIIHVVSVCHRRIPWLLSGQLQITATAVGTLLRCCVSMTHCKRKSSTLQRPQRMAIWWRHVILCHTFCSNVQHSGLWKSHCELLTLASHMYH